MGEISRQSRIALVGNIANNFYREGVALHAAGFDKVSLFFEKASSTHPSALPESDPFGGSGDYPEWVKPHPKISQSDWLRIVFGQRDKVSQELDALLREIDEHDVIFLSGAALFFSGMLASTTVFRPTGGDLTTLPFLFRSLAFSRLREGFCYTFTFANLARTIFLALLSRVSLRSVDWIAVHRKGPYPAVLKNLQVPKNKILPGIDLSINLSEFQRDGSARERLREDLDFVVLLVGKYMSRASRTLRDVGQWKGSDKALRAFATFLRGLSDAQKTKVELWIPDTSMSVQLAEARTLVVALGIQSNVRFVSGSDQEALSRAELLELYSAADVCLDDFGAGWFGSAALECLACETPLITWVSPEFLYRQYLWHPLLLARSREEISLQIARIYATLPEERADLGRTGRDWVRRYFSSLTTA